MVEPNTGKITPPPPLSTPRLAPWDAVQELCNRLDRLISVLEGLTLGGAPGEGAGVFGEVTDIWEAGPTREILAPVLVRAAGATNTEVIDFTRGKRLIIKVTSTLDQVTTVQVVGNIENSIIGAGNIGVALPCAAFSNITIGLGWGNWHPYIGVILTHAIPPTQGTVKVEAVIQN